MSDAAVVDGVDWGPGCGIEEGMAEAELAVAGLVSEVLALDGAGGAEPGESEVSRLWRCGTLRST